MPVLALETRSPDWREICPACAPLCKTPIGRSKQVRVVWQRQDGHLVKYCHRCEDQKTEPKPVGFVAPKLLVRRRTEVERAQLAAYLWSRSKPFMGTLANAYLSHVRGIRVRPPATLRFLPSYDQHPPAMIAAFGLTGENEPGRLGKPDHVCAVHLTLLSGNGLTSLGKRMVGLPSGVPIALAPPNDGLGLVIAEGVEDALSLHEATGLGAWAAGSAAHMGKLGDAVPDYIECVTLAEDDNKAGQKACHRLGQALLARGFEVRCLRLKGGDDGT